MRRAVLSSGRCSVSSGGVRQASRRSRSSGRHSPRLIPGGRWTLSAARLAWSRASARARRRTRSSTAATASPATAQTAKAYSHCASVTFGKKVVTSGASEKVSTAQAMMPATQFWAVLLDHGPRTGLSLASRIRNTSADGSRMPLSASTPSMTTPRSFPHARVTTADTPTSTAYRP